MLALAAANAVGVVLFGTLYALAGHAGASRRSGSSACLVALVRAGDGRSGSGAKARHRATRHRSGVSAARRIGLVAVVVGTPAVVLMPLFWLEPMLPADAGLSRLLGRRS